MTTTHKFIVFKTEKGICWVQKLGMENDFDAIIDGIEQVTTANAEKWKNKW